MPQLLSLGKTLVDFYLKKTDVWVRVFFAVIKVSSVLLTEATAGVV